jgi:hypothetical protein
MLIYMEIRSCLALVEVLGECLLGDAGMFETFIYLYTLHVEFEYQIEESSRFWLSVCSPIVHVVNEPVTFCAEALEYFANSAASCVDFGCALPKIIELSPSPGVNPMTSPVNI